MPDAIKLSDITEKTPLVKDFIQRLAKTTKQAVATTIVGKVKRTGGVSALPIDINLENGQVVTIYTRIITDINQDTKVVRPQPPRYTPDIFRVDVNGKQMPTTGDFSNDYKPSFNKSVDEVAQFIAQGQKAFDTKRTALKPARISGQSETMTQKKQLDELTAKAVELDQQIEIKQGEKQVLQDKLTTLKSQQITA